MKDCKANFPNEHINDNLAVALDMAGLQVTRVKCAVCSFDDYCVFIALKCCLSISGIQKIAYRFHFDDVARERFQTVLLSAGHRQQFDDIKPRNLSSLSFRWRILEKGLATVKFTTPRSVE